ncbi:MAG: hypothetical protein FRX49_04060 [Trebouxia sp. A1-2]|nr:MAG: hypothetical protein FRX49_04060 [Trebouxia sp. A1-2]
MLNSFDFRAADFSFDELTREDITRFGVQKLRLALQVAYLLSSFVVEWLKPSAGVRLLFLVRQVLTAVRTLAASTLPNSTPHWSKLLMPQMNPCDAFSAGQTDVDGEQMKQLVTRFGQPGAYSTTAAAYHLVIKFCVYLLDVRGQLGKGLCIGQDGTGGVAQETDVPDGG